MSKVRFRGRWTCACVATSLPLVEADMIRQGVIKSNVDLFQAGYNGTNVAASAGTHAGGGNTDVGQYSDRAITIWRKWGWTQQYRTRAQGFMPHGHGWPFGCPHLSAGGRAQHWDWINGRNGLRSRGRIRGKWPVVTYRAAIDAANRAAAKIRAKENELPNVEQVTRDIFGRDGVFSNAGQLFTGNKNNPSVAFRTAIESMAKRLVRLERAAASTKDQLDRIEAALKTGDKE